MAITLNGDNGNNVLTAGTGDDYFIYGWGGNDVLNGHTGNDWLDGGTGSDTMAGGAGNDTYIVDAVGDVVTEGLNAGTDTVRSSISWTLGANVENLVLTGSANLSATGNALANTITGNSGGNNLDGGAGNDTLIGGLGDDFYQVGDAGDVVVESAGAGTDWVVTTVSRTLEANVENLWMNGSAAINGTGNSLANLMQGNAGNNVLDGRLGADSMYGGNGNDTYWIETAGDTVTEVAGAGIDTVGSNLSYTSLGANVENLKLAEMRIFVNGGGALVALAAGVSGQGNELGNVIDGNSKDNYLYGLAGNDTMTGGAGNDYLDGGSGADAMAGGAGDDRYEVGSASDLVTEAAGEGYDTVYSTVSHTLGANVERLALQGGASINGYGNDLNNRIEGNDAANLIDGKAGADLMIGLGGNDLFYVDDAGDVVRDSMPGSDILLGGGTDSVISSVSYTLGYAEIENLSLTGSSALNGTGNASANGLWGNAGSNVLLGLAGDDGLYGLGGNDTLQGGTGSDTLRGGAGSDVLRAVDNVSLVNDGSEDRFVFDTALNASTNVDLIDKATFLFGNEGADDEIWLENSIFTALKSSTGTTSGALGAGYYFEGAGLTGGGQFDPIGIYLNTTTGELRYNATFGTASDAVLFAVVNNGIAGGSASLSADEFMLV